jgi:hypothetical protein
VARAKAARAKAAKAKAARVRAARVRAVGTVTVVTAVTMMKPESTARTSLDELATAASHVRSAYTGGAAW